MRNFILALFFIFSIPFASAEENKSAAPMLPALEKADEAKPLVQTRTTRVLKVIDQKRLMAGDQAIIELAGIEIPEDVTPEARDFLAALFADDTKTDILMYQTPSAEKGRVNRMQHDLAHVVRKDGHVWVQGAMIANGLARAMPTPVNPELAEKMYALENEAISTEKGLWAKDSKHHLLAADAPVEPLGRIVVVEGVVQKISTLSNTTYLNFGPDWRSDFTIGIPTAVRQQMTRQNIDLFKLQGQKLRVRGWIREYNGPYIELEHPVLLQRIESNDAKKP